MKKNLLPLLTVLFATAVAFSSGPSFMPDVKFTGSTTKGWHTLGHATWSADAGTITGTPSDGGSGWLVLDKSYQDISLYTEFRCEEGCEAGVLLRAEKTPDGGMKGFYVSLSDSSLTTYSVTIGPGGEIEKRDKLARGGLLARVTPPPSQSQGDNRPRPPTSNVDLPLKAADTSLRPHEWNSVEIFFRRQYSQVVSQ